MRSGEEDMLVLCVTPASLSRSALWITSRQIISLEGIHVCFPLGRWIIHVPKLSSNANQSGFLPKVMWIEISLDKYDVKNDWLWYISLMVLYERWSLPSNGIKNEAFCMTTKSLREQSFRTSQSGAISRLFQPSTVQTKTDVCWLQ